MLNKVAMHSASAYGSSLLLAIQLPLLVATIIKYKIGDSVAFERLAVMLLACVFMFVSSVVVSICWIIWTRKRDGVVSPPIPKFTDLLRMYAPRNVNGWIMGTVVGGIVGILLFI